MPFTINGIGTQYYFKKNEFIRQDVCEHCQRQATLSDYDVGWFFVVFYIPILPLGRQMILGQCNACSGHRAMPLSQWLQWRESSIERGLEKLSRNPRDPDAALELLGIYSAFHQMEDAWNLAEAMCRTHSDDYRVQLAVGGWYEQHDHIGEANDCFLKAVQLDPLRPESLRIRLVEAIEQSCHKEMMELALALCDAGGDDHLGVVLRAAEQLHAKNKSEDAYKLFERLLQLSPILVKDKDFRRAARPVELAVGRPASLVPAKRLGILD